MRLYLSLLLILGLSLVLKAQNYKILESSEEKLKLQFDFTGKYQVADTLIDGKNFNIVRGSESYFGETGKPWLPQIPVTLGIPANSKPAVRIISVDKEILKNKFIIPFPKDDPEFKNIKAGLLDASVYNSSNFYPADLVILTEPFFMRYIRVASLGVSPFQFNPVTRELIFNKKIIVEVTYNAGGFSGYDRVNDPSTEQFVKNNLINASAAASWITKQNKNNLLKKTDEHWYSPNKDYFKIYLKEEGLYRLSFDYLTSAGVPVNSIPVENFELINNGEYIPLYVKDLDSNGFFNEGDYLEFIGKGPKPSPYSKQNIYNTDNVYWFSYQGNSSGLFYNNKSDSLTNWVNSYDVSLSTLHFEQDELYERLGYAPDDKRDYWQWAKVTGRNGSAEQIFIGSFPGFNNLVADSHYATVRVNMHGMTTIGSCPADHRAEIYINDKLIGDIFWDGQAEATFERRFYISEDSVSIFPEGNRIKVLVKGDACSAYSDEIRVNWFEFDYRRYNRANTSYSFKSNPDAVGITRFWTWQWPNGNVKVFVPQRNEIITDYIFLSEMSNAVIFTDNVNEQTEYFMYTEDYVPFMPDSMTKDISSDLRNLSNGADYIIITHSAFSGVAENLAEFRREDFPDSSIKNARIVVADVQQIYDEFSYGMLDPYALQSFVKYAFENWQQPAPAYIVIVGDMSWDYRKLIPSSRPNFVPSIPVHISVGSSLVYGQAVSDNSIVAVSGDDTFPDLAIGRLSCETVEEGNILLDKIMNYPADNSKEWKQNVLLVSAGQDAADEARFNFNGENVYLENSNLQPLGITATKVFRYPNRPEYVPFQGDGPEIRAGFNQGAVLANYYGHGGGYQWDFVFLNDDIYLLNNGNRLPVISSTTCYTAHFDNQDVFGEQFIKVPGKGAIGFISSSALTLWSAGRYFNMLFFDEVFGNKVYNVGKAVLNASTKFLRSPEYDKQLSTFVYLGDPVLKLALPEEPDFRIEAEDISITPENPLAEDTVIVKIKTKNLGIIFSDSVTVQLMASSQDTSYPVGSGKLSGFGELDSISITWIPGVSGSYELTAKINDLNEINEADHTDNIATAVFTVFNISEPNIVTPVDGLSIEQNNVSFIFSDAGYYINKDLYYFIEIDTSLSFTSPFITSGMINPADGLLKWNSSTLSKGEYFWRARIFDGENYGNWSKVRGFSVVQDSTKGFLTQGKLLELFSTYNINYSDETKSLVLNNELLPPRPDKNRFLEHIFFPTTGIENLGLTTITTDGRYIYFANIQYYSRTTGGYSSIHKVGTGNSGTVKGQYYGTIPGFYNQIKNQMFYHSDGFIYVATGAANSLLKINPETGDSSTVNIPAGMLEHESARVNDGSFLITSDGQFVYNLTIRDTLGNSRYVLRTFDPAANWSIAKPDMILSGTSYPVFTGFFVAGGYLYPIEYFTSNFIRRIRLEDGLFEEEWLLNEPFQSYYSICYDWANNEVYASVYRDANYPPKFSKFKGMYTDAKGSIITQQIGPANKWNHVLYSLEKLDPAAKYTAVLKGYNNSSRQWSILNNNLPASLSIDSLDASEYGYLQLEFTFTDSSTSITEPFRLSKVAVDYEDLPEIILSNKDLTVTPDTLLQGLSTTINLNVKNIGGSNADSVSVKLFLNDADSAFYSKKLNLLKDSSVTFGYEIPTAALLFSNDIKASVSLPGQEYFFYNNTASKSFYVARDSVKPQFQITFDGVELVNEEVVRPSPEIIITLEDNGPLPIDTSYFTIVHNNEIMSFTREDLSYSYEPYPNSRFTIRWNPELEDGKHTLEILAKDASGNFFDSTSSRTTFYVYSQDDLLNIYNYPNPFVNETFFTFELRGAEVPDEFLIKVFTIAGRLIRDISVPASELKLGFNKVSWDGRDQDGDDIANGLYLYKVISKHNGQTRTSIEKMVKLR